MNITPAFNVRGDTLKTKKAPYRTIFATKSKPIKRFRKNLRHVQNHCHDLGNFFKRFRRFPTKPKKGLEFVAKI
jgi:hypothetical protein